MASINAMGENCWALSIEEFQFGTSIPPSLFYVQEEIEPWEIVRPFTPRSLSLSPSSSICLEQIFSCSFLLSLSIYKPNPIPCCWAARAHFPMGPFISFRGSAFALHHVWQDPFLMEKVYLRCMYTVFRSKCFYETPFCVCDNLESRNGRIYVGCWPRDKRTQVQRSI